MTEKCKSNTRNLTDAEKEIDIYFLYKLGKLKEGEEKDLRRILNLDNRCHECNQRISLGSRDYCKNISYGMRRIPGD